MDDLRHYFESIQKPFEEKLAAIDVPDHEEVAVVALPLLAMLVVDSVFMSERVVGWVFLKHGINVSTRPFAITAFTLMVMISFGIPVLTAIWNISDRRRRNAGLSDPQMRFALCHRILEELAFYQRNGLQPHTDEALRLWRILAAYLYWMLNPGSG